MVITDTVEKENELTKWRNNPKNWLPSNSTIPNNHIVSSYYKPSKKKDVTDNVKYDLKTNMIHTMISDAKSTGNFFEVGLKEKLANFFKSFISSLHEKEGKNLEFAFTLLVSVLIYILYITYI